MSDHQTLSGMAMRLFHIQPTNTAVERTFSKQKFIHRKERNRLLGDKVHKLMFINSNINTFDTDPSLDERFYVLESDSDGDDSDGSEEKSVVELSDEEVE